ncbi:MAG: TIGR03668 family PPOX class F420-dependent oxidoreductase [Chloroflexi bacterium]|nr:TIGR03668 family PPOX class F420-dependent oxidoreductase [Chloroflexota bacterium]
MSDASETTVEPSLSPAARAFLERTPVAHLATASAAAVPHVIPITFVWRGGRLYTALDAKPKRVAATRLRRVRNLLANPRVAVVVDRYCDDWSRLGYVLIEGHGRLLTDEPAAAHARAALRAKYPPYRAGALRLDEAPVLEIIPTHVVEWGDLTE